jgi:hypothetical protein
MAFLAVLVSACLLISAVAHAAEPLLDSHVAEQSLDQADHDSDGKGANLHGCLAHCHGHSFAAPPLNTALEAPYAASANWSPDGSVGPRGNRPSALERPPRV